MSRAVILQHVEFEGPGRIMHSFRDFGIPCEVRHLYRGDEVPSDLDELRVLIVLGGPMGVADVGSSQYPFLAKELELLKRMIAADRPVLGICLGAQLLVRGVDERVERQRRREPAQREQGDQRHRPDRERDPRPQRPPAPPRPQGTHPEETR